MTSRSGNRSTRRLVNSPSEGCVKNDAVNWLIKLWLRRLFSRRQWLLWYLAAEIWIVYWLVNIALELVFGSRSGVYGYGKYGYWMTLLGSINFVSVPASCHFANIISDD
jgi:hypothetical protein